MQWRDDDNIQNIFMLLANELQKRNDINERKNAMFWRGKVMELWEEKRFVFKDYSSLRLYHENEQHSNLMKNILSNHIQKFWIKTTQKINPNFVFYWFLEAINTHWIF